MDTSAYSTWVEIDLEAIRNNVRALRRISGVEVMAIVKANGYGHGMLEVAKAAVQGGAGWLGVARLDEAIQLRASGITQSILVLGYISPRRVSEALANRVRLTVYDPQLAEEISREAQKLHEQVPVHAKFDTGMGRLGMFPEDGLGFIQHLLKLPGLRLEGMFTHFARSDEPDLETTTWQNQRFQRLVDQLSQAGLCPPTLHAANSAAALYFPETRYDMVRCGISIYGLDPSGDAPLPEGFQRALTWKARLSSIKYLPENHGVGYSHRYTTQKRERIGVVMVGYADGFRRRVGNFALVGGRRVESAGSMCMDQMMLRLDDVPEVAVGDEVVLIGKQGDEEITAEELGREWETINYEVVCGLQTRVPRVYLNREVKPHEERRETNLEG